MSKNINLENVGVLVDIEKYTDKAKEIIQSSQTNAIAMNHQEIAVPHIFLAFLQDSDQLLINILANIGL